MASTSLKWAFWALAFAVAGVLLWAYMWLPSQGWPSASQGVFALVLYVIAIGVGVRALLLQADLTAKRLTTAAFAVAAFGILLWSLSLATTETFRSFE